MEKNHDDNRMRQETSNPVPHPPTDHNPYPYPIQKKNRRGWLYALLSLIAVAAVVTLVCLVVGIYDHHEEGLPENQPQQETVVMELPD